MMLVAGMRAGLLPTTGAGICYRYRSSLHLPTRQGGRLGGPATNQVDAMIIDFTKTDPLLAYQWLTATVTPRPIAWVSTRSAQGISNLAPFSFFQVVTGTPPTVMLSPLVQGDGSLKDTVRNIQETGEFVVNLVPFAMADRMNATAFGYEHGISEFERCHIPSQASEHVHPLRVDGASVSFECRMAALYPYPEHKPSCHIILGEVLLAHIDESILDERGRVDPARLDIIARMGGKWYSRTRSEANFELSRPSGWDDRSAGRATR